MKVLCLLAFIGAACALQAPQQYEYLYRGVVATAMPGIRPQVAGMGIKATLTLQMKSKSNGIAQLRDIEVGEYHDDLKDEHMRIPLPIHYSPMSQYASDLEKPFAVNFAAEMEHVLEVPSHEQQWLTNVRKAVVQMLYVEPLKSQLGEVNPELQQIAQQLRRFPSVFSTEEETIFGRCESQYTITPLMRELKEQVVEEVESMMTKDEERESVTDQYFRMVRAIDFNKCHDKVILQFSGVGNTSRLGDGQFESIQSRSSIGTYILKGSYEKFRIQRAIVEGAVVLNPYGIETDKIQAITNQTLILKSVQSIQTPLRLPTPTKSVNTWRYEVVSPYSPQAHQKQWMNYQNKSDKYFPIPPSYTLLGMVPSTELINQWKETTLQLLEEVAQIIPKIPEPPKNIPPMASLDEEMGYVLTYKLFEASQMIRSLPVAQIEEIFEKVFQQNDHIGQIKHALLVDIVAASGAAGPYKVLLEKMSSGQVSDARMFSLFPPLTVNLNNPVIIPELLKFVKSLNPQTHPFLTSSAHINFANLVNRICLTPKAFNYTLPNDLYGSEVCDARLIIEDYIPYLKQKIHSVSKTYERAIYLQALSKVGSPHVLSILHPVITGQVDNNPRLRIIAINGLVRERMPFTYKNEVFNILMEVVDRIEEEPVVREAAFIALLSWSPSPAWYQRMARSTWREPSRQMAAFVTITLESLAKSTDPFLKEQATYARFALPLTKPMTPSFKYAYNHIYSQYEPQNNMATFATFTWLQDFKSQIPTEIWSKQTQSFGGFRLNLGELGFSQQGLGQLIQKFTKFFKGESQSEEEREYSQQSEEEYYRQGGAHSQKSRQQVKSVESWIEERLRPESEERSTEFDALFFIRGWGNMYNMFPLNKEVIETAIGGNLIHKLLQGQRLNIIKYYNTAENEYFIPTEIGLPLIGQVSRPVLNVFQSDMKLKLKKAIVFNRFDALEVDFKSNTKLISKTMVRLRVLVPWNQKIVEAATCQAHEFNMPLYANLTMFDIKEYKNISLNLSPYSDKKIPVAYFHNIPYTAIKTFVPTKNMQIKVITVKEDKSPVVKSQFETDPEFTGIKAFASYIGDSPNPMETGKPFEYLTNPSKLMSLLVSPTAKFWQTYIVVDPSQSLAKNVSFTASYIYLEPKQQSLEQSPVAPILKQKLEEYSSILTTRGLPNPILGPMTVLTSALVLNSTRFYRRNELEVAFVNIQEKEGMTMYRVAAGFRTNYCPYEKSPMAIFFRMGYQTPNITTLEELKQKLSQNLEETYQGSVVMAKQEMLHEAQTIATFSGKNMVSEERKNIVLKELETVENFDHFDPAVELRTAAVYDKGHFEMKKVNHIPRKLMNLTNILEDSIRGIVFPFLSLSRLEVRNEQDVFKFHYLRPLSTSRFTFWTTKPTENSIVTNVWVPYPFSSIVPMEGLSTRQHQESSEMLYREPSSSERVCNISFTNQRVKTFDTVTFPYKPLHCWTTALLRNTALHKYTVKTRMDTNQNMYIGVFFKDGTNAEVTYDKLIVNGKPKETPVGQTIRVFNSIALVVMKVQKLDDSKMEVIIKDEHYNVVKIHVYSRNAVFTPLSYNLLHDKIRGMCGDYDGRTVYDKTGPQECLYKSNDELFKFSWTSKTGQNCDAQLVENKHNEVRKFQETCTKRPVTEEESQESEGGQSLTSLRYESSLPGDHFVYVYPIKYHHTYRPLKIYVCVPIHPIAKCDDHNDLKGRDPVTVESHCWLRNVNVPRVIMNHEREGYMTFPVKDTPVITARIVYHKASVCG